MKENFHLFAVVVLAAVGLAGCASAPPPPAPTPATPPAISGNSNLPLRSRNTIVRSLHGEITYAVNGKPDRLRVNMELNEGTVIKTDAGSETYLQVNGFTSTIKIGVNSTVELTKMEQKGGMIGGDSTTVITLKVGTVLGSVRKLSANGSYEIRTPNGVARIRGTDFSITADPLPGGKFKVTYSCVTGMIAVSAMVDGKEVTNLLQTGQEWVPGEGDVIRPTPVGISTDGGGVYLDPRHPPLIVLPASSSPNYIQPFNGAGAPNPAVDIGQNPYIHVTPPPPPPPVQPVPAHH